MKKTSEICEEIQMLAFADDRPRGDDKEYLISKMTSIIEEGFDDKIKVTFGDDKEHFCSIEANGRVFREYVGSDHYGLTHYLVHESQTNCMESLLDEVKEYLCPSEDY